MTQRKQSIITFKAEESLVGALQGIGNRSSFIRSAILAALENTCPVCLGTGILSPHQREHWETFSTSHSMRECDNCREWHLVCAHEAQKAQAKPEPGRSPDGQGR